MTGILDRIVDVKRQEVATLRSRRIPSGFTPRPVNLKRTSSEPLKILAEIKFKSPSAGALSRELSVAQRARAYERAGASVVSVLCDTVFFGGAYEHLTEARQACSLPLLCKEFVIDEIQLDWASAFGADLVLLIARCLGKVDLIRLHKAALDRGLTPLVEIANREEGEWVNELTSPVVGVNARDLDALVMEPGRATDVVKSVNPAFTRLYLSGLKTPSDIVQIREGNLDGALIGEILMRDADPEPRLRALVQAACPRN